jgi:hypothetical protein
VAFARVQQVRVEDNRSMGVVTREVANHTFASESWSQPSYSSADVLVWKQSDPKLESLSDNQLLASRSRFDEHAVQGKLSFSEFQKLVNEKVDGCIQDSKLPDVALDAWKQLHKNDGNLLSFEEFVKCELLWESDKNRQVCMSLNLPSDVLRSRWTL